MSDTQLAALLEPKPRPNRLTVQISEDPSMDPSFAYISPIKMSELNIYETDVVFIRGRHGGCSVALAAELEELPEDCVRISPMMAHNTKVSAGHTCRVLTKDVPYGLRVQILPFSDTLEGVDGDLFEQFLTPYFASGFRPVHEGDIFSAAHEGRSVDFKVMKVDPAPHCVVTPETQLFCEGDPLEREEEDPQASTIGYDDIGGLGNQIAQIREMVDLPLRHPVLFKQLGIKAPTGVLLHGPPGCGKTLIAKAVANETGAFFFLINGPEIMGMASGESESNLRKAFAEARSNSPSIIFIDEIDSIAMSRDKVQGEMEKRVVAQLLTLMDGLKTGEDIIVIGATNRPNVLDDAVRRFGRFDREICIGVPDEEGRLEVLNIKTKGMRLHEDVDLQAIAAESHGFVGADLASLCVEAGMLAVRDTFTVIDIEDEEIEQNVLGDMFIHQSHLETALSQASPSSLREMVVERPNTTWEDIGGLVDTKRDLQELIQFPVLFPEKFLALGMNPSRGVLFFGPPGCGKTLLAKAVARECKANFISIKGPELLSMWFGNSEENVRNVFAKARQSAPCVLFFDELDSIGRSRGSGAGAGGEASDRVMNQLLTELDGMGERKNVFVIGATNRPDILDGALMRPGRLDQLIYIPMPDFDSRVSIFQATLRKATLAEDIDFGEMGRHTEGFSGADCAEICQFACKLAIKESIDVYMSYKRQATAAAEEAEAAGMEFDGETYLNNLLVAAPELRLERRHLSQSLTRARKSVNSNDLQRYEQFRSTLVQSRAALGPATPAAPAAEEANAADAADDQFYE